MHFILCRDDYEKMQVVPRRYLTIRNNTMKKGDRITFIVVIGKFELEWIGTYLYKINDAFSMVMSAGIEMQIPTRNIITVL